MQYGQYEDRHKTCVEHANWLFTKRQPLLSLWQEIADNFYPERADFTYTRSLGQEFADNLATSAPVLNRRDLGNSISAWLRPPGETWGHMVTDRPDEDLDQASLAWLEQKTKVQFRAMTDPIARMTRATKEVDHDFVTFGNGVLSLEVNRVSTALLYRSWHLRDVVWCERFDGSIGKVCRKWKPTARDLLNIFGKEKVSEKVVQLVTASGGKQAYKEVNVMHIVVPASEYDGPKIRQPYVSLYIDIDNKFVMEEVGSPTQIYIIPRWETISGSQYAYSPATVAGLPDGRLAQQIAFTLLKAGEKAVDPPMIATEEAIRSPIDIKPGGVTWVASDYDEKLGEVLRPMTIDSRGIPVGMNMQEQIGAGLISSFYLNKLQLPQFGPEMTAYEVSQRLQEYIRQALPLFEPIEEEYNAPLCEQTFQLLLLNNAFGPVEEIPEMLQGRDIRFRFESPLVEAGDQRLVQVFTDALNMSQMAGAVDPSSGKMLKVQTGLRAAYRGRQVPQDWLESEDEMEGITEQVNQQQQAAQMAQQVSMGAQAADQLGQAGQSIQGALSGGK